MSDNKLNMEVTDAWYGNQHNLLQFRRPFLVLGAIQLTLGLLAIIVSATNLALIINNTEEDEVTILQLITPGLWAGFIFIVAGSLSVSASKRLTQAQITGALTVSIFAALFAAGMLTIEILNSLRAHFCMVDDCSVDESLMDSLLREMEPDEDKTVEFYLFVIHSSLCGIAFVELLAAVVTAAYGCRVMCCRGRTAVVDIADEDITGLDRKSHLNEGFVQESSNAFKAPRYEDTDA